MIVNAALILDKEWIGTSHNVSEGVASALQNLGIGVVKADRCEDKSAAFAESGAALTLAVGPEWFEKTPEENDCLWVKNSRVPVVAWLIEKMPSTGDSEEPKQIAAQGRSGFYIDALPHFDFVFTAYEADIERLQKLGISNVEYLPFGVDETVFKPLNTPRDVEIGFIGWKIHAPRRAFYHHLVSKHKMQRLIAWRDQMTRKDATEAYVKALNRINMCVNMPNTFTGISTRVTEALACETFLIQPRPPENFERDKTLFADKKEIAFYDPNSDEIDDIIEFYRSHPEKRSEIAWAGRKAVLERHTLKHRIKTMFEILTKQKVI